jgi:hypothetical protein
MKGTVYRDRIPSGGHLDGFYAEKLIGEFMANDPLGPSNLKLALSHIKRCIDCDGKYNRNFKEGLCKDG